MAKYFNVSPNIWNPQLREVTEKCPEALGVHHYLTSCRHRGSEGIFSLNKAYVPSDTGFSPEVVEKAFEVLTKAGYISYDPDNEVMLDRHALLYYKPVGDSQMRGALNYLGQVPSSPLKKEFAKIAYDLAPDFYDRIVEAFPELTVVDPLDTLSTPSRHGIDTASRAELEKSRSREESRRAEQSRGSNGFDSEESNFAALDKTGVPEEEGGF